MCLHRNPHNSAIFAQKSKNYMTHGNYTKRSFNWDQPEICSFSRLEMRQRTSEQRNWKIFYLLKIYFYSLFWGICPHITSMTKCIKLDDDIRWSSMWRLFWVVKRRSSSIRSQVMPYKLKGMPISALNSSNLRKSHLSSGRGKSSGNPKAFLLFSIQSNIQMVNTGEPDKQSGIYEV